MQGKRNVWLLIGRSLRRIEKIADIDFTFAVKHTAHRIKQITVYPNVPLSLIRLLLSAN